MRVVIYPLFWGHILRLVPGNISANVLINWEYLGILIKPYVLDPSSKIWPDSLTRCKISIWSVLLPQLPHLLICQISPHNCAWLTQEQVGWGCQPHQAHRPAPSVVNLMATWVRASISSCTPRVLDNVCGLHSWSIFVSAPPDVPPENMKYWKQSLLSSFDLFRCQFFQCGLLMLSLTSRSGVIANILSRRIPLKYSAGELEHQPNEEGW